MPSNIRTPFKDYVAPKPPNVTKPTLGDKPTGKVDSSDAGVSGTVKPVALPENDLHHLGKR